MNIAILTSSRADYGIYLPLIKVLKNEPSVHLSIIAFGTHLSKTHGYTLQNILDDGFNPILVNTRPINDSPKGIAECIAKTVLSFASVWEKYKFNLVFCLGDRYEMFAACASGIPFNLMLAHISGGEQTSGAIDQVFRHAITHMSNYHFTSTEQYKQRVIELKGDENNVHNVGALNIDNLKTLPLLSIPEFKQKFNIDLSKPSILITFHPETVSYNKNEQFGEELISALNQIENYQFIITMPNADTIGNVIREKLNVFIKNNSNAIGVESFGTIGYLSCMKHCSFLLGNTSSGFVEASFFPKYVINLGNRQNGRIMSNNIINCEIDAKKIISAVNNYKFSKLVRDKNIYGDGNSANRILQIIKTIKLK